MDADTLRKLAAEGNIAIEEAIGDMRPLILWMADAADRLRAEVSGGPCGVPSGCQKCRLLARFDRLGEET